MIDAGTARGVYSGLETTDTLSWQLTRVVWNLERNQVYFSASRNIGLILTTTFITSVAVLRLVSPRLLLYGLGLAADVVAIYLGFFALLIVATITDQLLGGPDSALHFLLGIIIGNRIIVIPLLILFRDYVTFGVGHKPSLKVGGVEFRIVDSRIRTPIRVALRNAIPAMGSTLLFLEDSVGLHSKTPIGFWGICLELVWLICMVDMALGVSFRLSGLWPVMEKASTENSGDNRASQKI